jgi:indolepyruvate ferredoxin oxidoreductase alpha subunit
MSTGDALDHIILGAGVAPEHLRIIEPTPANHDANVQILRDELSFEGTSVIVARRTCLEAIKRKA